MPNSPLHSRVVGNWEVSFWFARYPFESGGDCRIGELHRKDGTEAGLAVRNPLVSFRSFGQWIGLND
jgi:hypothetical protein